MSGCDAMDNPSSLSIPGLDTNCGYSQNFKHFDTTFDMRILHELQVFWNLYLSYVGTCISAAVGTVLTANTRSISPFRTAR